MIGASLATLAASAHGELHAPKRLLPAHDRHRGLDAAFQDYSGWQRPAYYAAGASPREATIEAECLAGCGFPTCVQINSRYYENVTPADVQSIVEHLKAQGD